MRLLAPLFALCLSACVATHLAPGKTPESAASINMQLAIEYMKLDKLGTAREFIERALDQDPRNAAVQITAGLVYERLDEKAKADRAFAAGAHLGKDDPNIQNNYAGYLCRTHRAAEGEKIFLKVVRNPLYMTPEVAYVNLGVCVHEVDAAAAERYFRQALSIRPNMAEALLQLGSLMLDRGDAAQALTVVQRYLAVNAAGPDILWLAMRVERNLGDDTAAAGYARRLQVEFPNSEQARSLQSGNTR